MSAANAKIQDRDEDEDLLEDGPRLKIKTRRPKKKEQETPATQANGDSNHGDDGGDEEGDLRRELEKARQMRREAERRRRAGTRPGAAAAAAATSKMMTDKPDRPMSEAVLHLNEKTAQLLAERRAAEEEEEEKANPYLKEQRKNQRAREWLREQEEARERKRREAEESKRTEEAKEREEEEGRKRRRDSYEEHRYGRGGEDRDYDRRDRGGFNDDRDYRSRDDDRDYRSRDDYRDGRDGRDSRDHRDSRKGGRNGDRNGVPLPSVQEQAQMQQLRERYMGPDLSKSKFLVKKKRRRNGQEFKFDWDPEDDTRNLEDERRREAEDAPFRDQLTSTKTMNVHWNEEEYELRALKDAHFVRLRDPEHGPERARKIMEAYFQAREIRNRPYQKMRHWSDKRLDEMRERDWRIFKEDFGIATKGGAVPDPMRSWRESGLPPALLDVVEQVGYKEPTPIQRAAIPIALQGRDLIGVAVTGSGKTAAFLLPLLVYIQELPPLDELNKNDGPYALILAPTRELAQQIEAEARKFAAPFGYTVVSIVGGHSLEEQAYALRNGAEIVVATPGRLVDCLDRRLLVLSQCCYVIMDEADRMIDLGFEEPLNRILDAMPTANEKPDTDEAEDAQAMSLPMPTAATATAAAAAAGGHAALHRYRETMMYTATMPPLLEKIAKRYLRRPATVMIGNAGEAVDTVEQRVEFVAGEDRRKKRMQEILQSGHFAPPIIVFVNIKRNCEMVARDIRAMGFSVVTLHGSKTQEQREAALATLRLGKADVLVATDLAGRGIDVAGVSLVINFNMATSIEQYTHRVGRTGRAGLSGVAITFLGSEDNDVLYDLKQMISKSSVSKLPDELRRHEAAQQKPTKVARIGQ